MGYVLPVADCIKNRGHDGNLYPKHSKYFLKFLVAGIVSYITNQHTLVFISKTFRVAKIKSEKKAKERERREIESNNRRHLANVRVVQKNLVYVIGLPSNLATEEILRGQDYFGQFGRINKIVINRRQTNNVAASTNASANSNHPTVGVYVTYATKEEATRAINAVDGSMLESRVLRATFGTTKYCSYYLRNIPCQNPNCMYLHEPGEEADSFTKEDLAANRAEMRDSNNADDSHHPHQDGYDEQHTYRGSSKSPGAHMVAGSGRSTAVPQASAAGNSNSRLRKGSDINGSVGSSSRPRSVDPHNSLADHTRDGSGNMPGSALPATASWASKPMSKKPQTASSSSATTATATAEASDSKGRKSGGAGSGSSSGAMTLRMIPSSRNGKATATAAANSNTTKALAGSNVQANSDETQSSAQTPASDSAQHHPPVLQQLTRERKQQLRHQARAQQRTTTLRTPVAADEEEVAVETSLLPTKDQMGDQETIKEDISKDEKATTENEEEEEAKTKETAANSALSFQSITDSLFAQLNAKVSTPPGASSTPSFASASATGSGAGGSSGFAMSNGMDPLMFPSDASMSINSANAASSASAGSFGIFADGSGSVHNPSSIDFMNAAGSANQQQLPQHHTWGYSQPQITPLSSLLTDSSSLNQSFSGGSNGGVGMTRTASSSSTRQRSRWDFVQQQSQADEASAQQELQSVLGRGGPFSGNSRDLGLFATPIQGDYNSNNNNLLSSISGRSSTSMAAAAPFPPPGFGSRQQQVSASSPLGTLPPSQLNVGAPPPSAPLSAGLLSSGHNTTTTSATSSALLSRLMSQQPSSPLGGLVDSTTSSSFYHPSLSPPQQQSLYQDPAILSTSMAPGMPPPQPPGTLPPSSRVGQTKGDSNALNSLLAKLQLGGGGEGKSSTSGSTTPLTGQDIGGNNSSMFGLPSPSMTNSSSSAAAGMASNGFVDPAIMQIGRNSSVSSAVGPPPGIMPTMSGDGRMVSRSANSSGRSRFLNHFGSGVAADSNSEAASTPKGSNGDPPGLPTTGVFGELVRKAKQDGAVTNGGGCQQQQQLQQHTAAANDAFSGGKMMLSDIEQKLEMARQEARQLQAQLSTVIGQNRSAMMALASNTSTSSSTAAGTSGGNGATSQ